MDSKVARLLKKVEATKLEVQRNPVTSWTAAHLRRYQHFPSILDDLFDISACQCKVDTVPCKHRDVRCQVDSCQREHLLCNCDHPIPRKYRQYIRFRRTGLGENNFTEVAEQPAAPRPDAAEMELDRPEEPRPGLSPLQAYVARHDEISPGNADRALLLEGIQDEPASQRSTQTQTTTSTQTSVSTGTQYDEVNIYIYACV